MKILKTNLQKKLEKYIFDTRNPEKNFWLGYEYEKQNQYAAALSYYLRCAELSNDENLTYECLLKSWWCFKLTGRRPLLEYGQLLEAISHSPHRPEAYYYMCQWFDNNGECKHFDTDELYIRSKDEVMAMCYSYSCIGIMNISNDKPFLTKWDYPGIIGLLFYKGYSSWHRGKIKMSEDIFIDLYDNYPLSDYWKELVENNLKGLDIENRVKKNNKVIPPTHSEWGNFCGSCLSNCCSAKGGDWIIGPHKIEDANKFIKDYNKNHPTKKTFDDFFIGFEEGKKLFPADKTNWQPANNYPAFRIKNNPTNSCVNYDDLNKKCSVYDIRPPVCRDYVCDALAEFKNNNNEIKNKK